jgi:hypothetical protein
MDKVRAVILAALFAAHGKTPPLVRATIAGRPVLTTCKKGGAYAGSISV